MLNDKAQIIFRELLDVNYEMTTNPSGKNAMRYLELQSELSKEMGAKAYQDFMTLGKKMFQPKN
jgi:hypothetical protein